MPRAPEERDARFEKNKQWYRNHPKSTKSLKATAALTLVFLLVSGCSATGTQHTKGDDVSTATADTEVVDDTAAEDAEGEAAAAAAKEAEEKAQDEAAAARGQAAKQARIEARKEAAREARIEARKVAAKQARMEARQAAAERRRRAAATQVSYANCTEVEDAGAAPIYAGEPGFGDHLDRDGDGVACEQ